MTVSVLPTSMTRSTALPSFSLLVACLVCLGVSCCVAALLATSLSRSRSETGTLGPDQIEPEVEHGGRMGEGPDRDPIRPCRRVVPDGGEGHAARDFGEDRPRGVAVRHGDGL